MRPKYILEGGFIYAKDKDRHWISPERLLELYGLHRGDCILLNKAEDRLRLLQGIDPDSMIRLGPRMRGDYSDYLEKMQEYHERKNSEADRLHRGRSSEGN